MSPLRIAAIMEAYSVTGPAKNLIRFARLARTPHPSLPPIEIHVLTYFRGPGAPSNAFLDTLSSAEIPFTVIRESRAFDPSVLPQLRDSLARLAPHIVQTHSVKSHFLCRLAGLPSRYPWVAFHHGYTNENLKTLLYRQLDRWSLRIPRRIVTVCTPFAHQLASVGIPSSRIEIIPNSIESSPAPSPPADLFPGAQMILHIGRFSAEKNHRGLIAAFTRLCQRRPELNLQLVLAGDGVSKSQMEALAASSPVSARIHFPGHLNNIWPLLRRADLFILPSLSEGSPNVILEAMAANKPIVASAVGGIPDLVPHNQAALLVNPTDTAAISTALETLLTQPALAARLTAAAQQRLSLFAPETHRQRLSAVYLSVLPSQPSTASSTFSPTERQS